MQSLYEELSDGGTNPTNANGERLSVPLPGSRLVQAQNAMKKQQRFYHVSFIERIKEDNLLAKQVK